MRLSFLAGFACSAALLVATTEARAGSDDGYSAAGSAAIAVLVTDFGFLVYDTWRVDEGSIDRGVMIAQTAVWSPQAAAVNFGLAWGQVDDEDSAALTLGFMVPSLWANGMATFGAWTVASERLPIEDRFAVSWLIGSNVTFSTGAITSFFRPTHVATPWLSTPEAIVETAQTVGCVIWAARDEEHRAEWLALGGWSALLAAHGFVSIVAWDEDRPDGTARGSRSRLAGRSGPPPVDLRPMGPGDGPGLSFSGVF